MNCFIATGNLGKDIDISKTKKGTSIGAFPLPVKQGRPVIMVDDLKMHSSNASPQKPAPKKPSETTFFDDEIPF